MASWYGPGFRGKPTASGERFRPSRRTAAHKTLPFGTVLLVEEPKSGRTVRVVFRFSTVSAVGNAGEGVYLDDITLFSGCQ